MHKGGRGEAAGWVIGAAAAAVLFMELRDAELVDAAIIAIPILLIGVLNLLGGIGDALEGVRRLKVREQYGDE